MNRPHQPQECQQCGATFRYGDLARHLQSPYHRERRAARFRRLLAEDPHLSMADLGRMFGLSRERVRQIVTKKTNREWSQPARKSRRGRYNLKADKVLGEPALVHFLRKDLGYRVRPVIRYCGDLAFTLKKQIEINGKKCAIRNTSRSQALLAYKGPGYVMVGPFDKQAPEHQGVKFVLYRICAGSPESGWIVVPAEYAPRCQRPVKLTEAKWATLPDGRPSPWRGWINNWDQLASTNHRRKKEEHAAPATASEQSIQYPVEGDTAVA